jgi:hypothetical protein
MPGKDEEQLPTLRVLLLDESESDAVADRARSDSY